MNRLLVGDCLALMPTLSDGVADAIVTDPPYGLGFMGVKWDTFKQAKGRGPSQREMWDHVGGNHNPSDGFDAARTRLSEGRKFQDWCEAWAFEALRVVKPGAYMLAFGGTRVSHRLTCGIENAGFEIQDTLSWLYGSGFPKHKSKLKPAWEPIILARRPAAKATMLNIDACRLEVTDEEYARNHSGDRGHAGTRTAEQEGATNIHAGGGSASALGRWPANVVLDEEAAAQLDAQSGELVSGANPTRRGSDKFRNAYGDFEGQAECVPARGVDVGGASRFYYCAKASRAERNAGLDGREKKPLNWSSGTQSPGTFQSEGTDKSAENHHPTVKPLALMRWLCRLVTPVGGVVLDPFMGSGSTGIAARQEGFEFIGIDEKPEYIEIATARIAHWEKQVA